MKGASLMLVEDDQSFGYILSSYLEMNAYRVTLATNGSKALELVRKYPFDLCILDVMLPDIEGFEIARQLNQMDPDLPFIFLTARALKVDKLKGYKLGCDDYITKPVDEELLIAKIQAIINRSRKIASGPTFTDMASIGTYSFDIPNQKLIRNSSVIQLTEKESHLLKLLCDDMGQLVIRERVLKKIWGKNDLFNRKTMDVFIFRLRKYLSKDPNVAIRNIRGRGFVLEVKGRDRV